MSARELRGLGIVPLSPRGRQEKRKHATEDEDELAAAVDPPPPIVPKKKQSKKAKLPIAPMGKAIKGKKGKGKAKKPTPPPLDPLDITGEFNHLAKYLAVQVSQGGTLDDAAKAALHGKISRGITRIGAWNERQTAGPPVKKKIILKNSKGKKKRVVVEEDEDEDDEDDDESSNNEEISDASDLIGDLGVMMKKVDEADVLEISDESEI